MGNHGAASARGRADIVGNRAIPAADAATPPAKPRSGTLSNWPVSRRLFAVIAMALVMGLVFGGLRVAGAESSASQFGRVYALALLGEQTTILAQDLQNERDETLGAVAGGLSSLKPVQSVTDAAAAKVLGLAAKVDGSYPANIQSSVAALVSQINGPGLATLRGTTKDLGVDGLGVIAEYAAPVNDIITLNDQIAQGTSDSPLATNVRALNLLALAKDQAAQQRGLFYNTFIQQYFGAGVVEAATASQSAELVDEAAFQSAATPAEQSAFNTTVIGPGVNEVESVEDYFFIDGNDDPSLAIGSVVSKSQIGFSLGQAPGVWYRAASQKIDQMQSVELTIAQNIVARAQALQSGAQRSAFISAIITAVVFLLVLLAASLVARSLVLPLRRLRIGALDIASRQLPERVMQLSESPDPTAELEVAPINVLTSDEIGQVARAFDQVHAEAVRLAGNEAMLRTSFNAMFVNLSRRSQSLIERLARMIEALEQNEDDPDRLSSLFSMDHMVTRMRRNSENLLLLAGHEGARKWSEPVALADVARAATSEIEHYRRVVLSIQPGIAVAGLAVSDVVHLLAELIENATLFSPKDTQVQVSAQELTSGGVLIEITDKGIGVSDARLAEMNWRLDNTPTMDVSVSRHMGLFAVARLAVRHQVRVRLRPANPQGLTALVWLPDTVIERTGRGFTTPAGLSKPFAAQGVQGRRSPGQHSIGTRSALDGRRTAAVGAGSPGPGGPGNPGGPGGPAQLGAGTPGLEPEYEQLSNWFRSRRISATGVGTGSAPRLGNGSGTTGGWPAVPAPPPPGSGAPYGTDPWTQQRHAAGIIADPVRGDQTSAGLPVRVPKANLIPGSAGARPAEVQPGQPLTSPLPQRSPEMARSRLSGFQRGSRRAEGQQQRAEEGADS